MPQTDLIRLAEQLTAAAARQDGAAMTRIARAYQSMYGRLSGQIETLAQQIGTDALSAGQVARLSRYKSLMLQIERELNDLAIYTRTELSTNAEAQVARALRDSRSLISTTTAQAGITVGFNALPAQTVINLLGFLGPKSPLYARLKMLAPTHADAISKLFVDGIGLGWNPRKIAAAIRRQFGMGLVDALRMTRTAGLYAYRETNRASYIANSDVVSGWQWMAAINNPNVCPSCLRMHGTKHANTERLNDHHNGRCAMLPIVKGFAPPIDKTGEQIFNEMSDADRRAMLGRDYHQAWKDGLYSFSDISTERPNDVYGPMRGVTPLWQLLGAEPPVRMR
jgi:hypothetical protein